MSIKSFLILLVTAALSLPLSGQSLINPSIQSALEAYIDHTNKKEWDQAFDYLYPRLFDQVSRDDLKQLMGGAFEGISMHTGNLRILSTSVPVEHAGETFVKVSYTADIKVMIEPGGVYDHMKPIGAMQEQFEQGYGKEAVTWSEEFKTFTLKAEKAMMAIDTGNSAWKVVELDPSQAALNEKLFPQPVLEALVRTE